MVALTVPRIGIFLTIKGDYISYLFKVDIDRQIYILNIRVNERSNYIVFDFIKCMKVQRGLEFWNTICKD